MCMKVLSLLAAVGICMYAHAEKNVKNIKLDNETVATVYISPRGTVLSFPTKPEKVILGEKNSFGIEYVENDLAISPYRSNSRSNLFVYMQKRRFVFDLVTSLNNSYSLVIVTDSDQQKVRVR